MNEYVELVRWELRGKKLKYLKKKSSATFSTTNAVFIALELNPGLRDALPATTRLNYVYENHSGQGTLTGN